MPNFTVADGASYRELTKQWCALVAKISTTLQVLYAGATVQSNEESVFTNKICSTGNIIVDLTKTLYIYALVQ